MISLSIDESLIGEPLTKICNGNCKKELTLDHFHKKKTGKYGRGNTCGPCRSLQRNPLKPEPLPIDKSLFKICQGNCKQKLTLDHFHKKKTGIHGCRNICGPCTSLAKKNPNPIKKPEILPVDSESLDKPLTITCIGKCKQELTLDHFHKAPKRKYGHTSICKPCLSLKRNKPIVVIELTDKPITKICVGECQQELTLDNFHKKKKCKYGVTNICKPCRSTSRNDIIYESPSEGEKICNGPLCDGQIKSVKEFDKQHHNKTGLEKNCSNCRQYLIKISSSTFEGFIGSLINNTKHHCKTNIKGLEMSITMEDVKNLYQKQKGKCALTHQVLTHTKLDDADTHHDEFIKHRWNISIDRIDSSKGYTIDNIHLIGARINIMKSDLPVGYFVELCKKIANFYSEPFYNDSYCFEEYYKSTYSKDLKFNQLINKLIKRTKRGCLTRPKNISFNITIEDIQELYHKQKGVCALTKQKLTHNLLEREKDNHCMIVNRWNISIDRIDSSKGYEKDNIQLLGCIINMTKSDLPQSDFIEICKLFL